MGIIPHPSQPTPWWIGPVRMLESPLGLPAFHVAIVRFFTSSDLVLYSFGNSLSMYWSSSRCTCGAIPGCKVWHILQFLDPGITHVWHMRWPQFIATGLCNNFLQTLQSSKDFTLCFFPTEAGPSGMCGEKLFCSRSSARTSLARFLYSAGATICWRWWSCSQMRGRCT